MLWFVSCDDGDIYSNLNTISKTGKTYKVLVNVVGAEMWPAEYNVVVAGFGTDQFANISKNIQIDGNQEIIVSGVDESVFTMEICVINRLRERIATFYEHKCIPTNNDTIVVDAGTLNVCMFNAIQTAIFNPTCVACHGGNNKAAAGLFLTPDKSYNALVNAPSKKSTSGAINVVPNDVDNSFLYNVAIGKDNHLAFDHTNMIISYVYLDLIKSWINNGAKK